MVSILVCLLRMGGRPRTFCSLAEMHCVLTASGTVNDVADTRGIRYRALVALHKSATHEYHSLSYDTKRKLGPALRPLFPRFGTDTKGSGWSIRFANKELTDSESPTVTDSQCL